MAGTGVPPVTAHADPELRGLRLDLERRRLRRQLATEREREEERERTRRLEREAEEQRRRREDAEARRRVWQQRWLDHGLSLFEGAVGADSDEAQRLRGPVERAMRSALADVWDPVAPEPPSGGVEEAAEAAVCRIVTAVARSVIEVRTRAEQDRIAIYEQALGQRRQAVAATAAMLASEGHAREATLLLYLGGFAE